MVAVISDGDIRRYLLGNADMNVTVGEMANHNPRLLKENERNKIKEYFMQYPITALPVIDQEGSIVEIWLKNGKCVRRKKSLNLPVVIMAGGKGTRLYPYTQILPKPLIPIGEKTITEHILERFLSYDCKNVYMIVNYKKKFIETYFQEIDERYRIEFVEEDAFYGTGGGLKLLKDIHETFFMTNCDILIDVDYAEILSYHRKKGNLITMVCARYEMTLPYGVVEVNDAGHLMEMNEKPSFTFLTNTGFYVMEPGVIDQIPGNTHIDMTDIIKQCSEEGERVGCYVIEKDAWMDMGQMDQLEKMRKKLEGEAYVSI